MLILSRKAGEAIYIDDRIKVHVLGVRGKQIRLGIEAPADVHILRSELVDRSHDEAAPPQPLVCAGH
jgi:carbon storage regulator